MLQRPDRHDVLRFLGCYLVLTLVWFGLGRAVMAADGVVREDERVARWFVDHRTSSMNHLTAIGSGLAETVVKIGVTLVAVIVCRLIFHRWLESLVLALPLVLEAAVFITVTTLVHRPRPPVPRLESSPVNSSFPSGHVAAAAVYGAVVIVVALHTRRWWPRVLAAVVTMLVVAAVAWSRMYRGMHHLSDVIAGALLGLVSVLVSWWMVRHMIDGDVPVRAHEEQGNTSWASA